MAGCVIADSAKQPKVTLAIGPVGKALARSRHVAASRLQDRSVRSRHVASEVSTDPGNLLGRSVDLP